MLPTPGITRRSVAIAREMGCDSVWFGAAAPLALMAATLEEARRRTSHRGDDARPRGVVGEGAGHPPAAAPDRRDERRADLPGGVHAVPDQPGAVPDRGCPDGAAHAGCRHGGLPPVGRRSAGSRSLRPRRSTGDRVRLPAGGAQGPGHAGPGAAAGAEIGSRCRRPARRRRTDAARAGDPRRGARGVRRRGPRGCRALGGPAAVLRGRRRLLHAVPHPQGSASSRKASASSTWRPRRPGCPWSRGARAGRRTPSSSTRPDSWWTAGSPAPSPNGSHCCSATRRCAVASGQPAANGSSAGGSGPGPRPASVRSRARGPDISRSR